MNYLQLYTKLTTKDWSSEIAADGYKEKHHIIPRSCGGTDNKDNLVDLSAKAHFVAHKLLTKIYAPGTPEYKSMKIAMLYMCYGRRTAHYKVSSRDFARIRLEYAKNTAGANHSRAKIANIYFHEELYREKANISEFCKEKGIARNEVYRSANGSRYKKSSGKFENVIAVEGYSARYIDDEGNEIPPVYVNSKGEVINKPKIRSKRKKNKVVV